MTGRHDGGLRGGPALAILVVAVNLRAAVVAVSPVLDTIRETTGLSATGAGLLTTIPVICFGAFAPLAPRLGRRFGMEATLAAAMLLLTGGILLRLVPGYPALFGGTLFIGAAIATGNVLLPALTKRDFPLRVGLLTGLYITVMSTGATIAAGATVPLQDLTGASWQVAISIWAIPAALAALLWLRNLRIEHRDIEPDHPIRAVRGLWRDPIARQVTAFMGLQSFGFYASVAWLPTVFIDHGISSSDAGLLLALASLVGVLASLVAPTLATRARDQRRLVAGSAALVAIGFAGVVVAPTTLPALWMVLLGVGQGASLGVALTIIGLRSPDAEHASELSSVAQGGGYLFASLGPLAVGAIHEATGSWTTAVGLLLVLVVPQLLAGLGAGRDRLVGGP